MNATAVEFTFQIFVPVLSFQCSCFCLIHLLFDFCTCTLSSVNFCNFVACGVYSWKMLSAIPLLFCCPIGEEQCPGTGGYLSFCI